MTNSAILVVKNHDPGLGQSYVEYYGHLDLSTDSNMYKLYAPCLIRSGLMVISNCESPLIVVPDDVLEVKMLSRDRAQVYDKAMRYLYTLH
jgi:hypothetical protein